MSDNNKTAIEQVVELYTNGGSDVEVAALLQLPLAKFYELSEENPSFAQVVERGRTLAQAWWYKQGRLGLFADKFSAATYNFNMKNR